MRLLIEYEFGKKKRFKVSHKFWRLYYETHKKNPHMLEHYFLMLM